MVSPNHRLVNIAALALLAAMALLMFTSMWNDTLTFDEVAHVGSGYSYLRKLDGRLNTHHPPLFKDLAAIPLLFLHLKFPWGDRRWVEDRFDEWDFGNVFIFHSGGDPDSITRLARTPMILLTLAFGWFLFWWTRRQFGDSAALLALFFYTSSPTFIAHGRFVTNDVASAAGFFLGLVAYLDFLRNPVRRTILISGFALALALLTKYSTVLLLPIFVVLAALWALFYEETGRRLSSFRSSMKATSWIFLVAYLSIYPIYLFHTWKYPPSLQRRDTITSLEGHGVGHTPKDIVIWASDKPLLRPYAHYFRGVLMTIQRSNSTDGRFFLGEIYHSGIRPYFPFVYLVKEPLAFQFLTILALAFGISRLLRPVYKREWLTEHFTEVAFLIVLAVYWFLSIRSSLNIGVRHLLPTFAFVYVLVANEIVVRYRRLRDQADEIELEGLSPFARNASLWALRSILGIALAWQVVSVGRVHPSYLAYFNELAGGPDGGSRYVVDSNIDWGQDLKRLSWFVEQHGIQEIHLDYFGAVETGYYLKGKERGISGCAEPQRGWVAVSVMSYQHSREQSQCDYRRWLPIDKLTTKIGYSIFLFRNSP